MPGNAPSVTGSRRFQTSPAERRNNLRNIDNIKLDQVEDPRGFWRIECNCQAFHKAPYGLAKWCDHAQDLLKTHGDVDFEGGRILDPWVRVTVIINPGLEAWFLLDDPDESGFRTVTLVVPDDTSPATNTRFFLKKPMGLIHENSGRLELRTLMLEWLIGQTGEGQECRAVHHEHGASPYENQDKYTTSRGNPGFAVMVDYFDLFTTGNCRSCNQNNGVPDL